jgi:hypothetical protein
VLNDFVFIDDDCCFGYEQIGVCEFESVKKEIVCVLEKLSEKGKKSWYLI